MWVRVPSGSLLHRRHVQQLFSCRYLLSIVSAASVTATNRKLRAEQRALAWLLGLMEATSGSQPENVSSILTGVIGKPYNMILYRFFLHKNTSGSCSGGRHSRKTGGENTSRKIPLGNASGKTPLATAPAGLPLRWEAWSENRWGTYMDHPDGIHMIRKKKSMTGSKY